MFVRGTEDPRIPESEIVTGGVLITLNPIVTLQESDTQVLRKVPDGVEHKTLQYNMTTYLDYYESLTPQQYNNRVNRLEGQINDEPLIEFLEPMVQNIFGNSEYSLRLDSQLSREGGMDFGTFSYNGHVALVFVVFSVGMVMERMILTFWTRKLAIRDINDLADIALMSKITEHTSATILEAADYRFEPTLKVTGFGPCYNTMKAIADVHARNRRMEQEPIDWDKEQAVEAVYFDAG